MSHRQRLGSWRPSDSGFGREYELSVHRTDSMLATVACAGCPGQVLAGHPAVIARGTGDPRTFHPSCAARVGIRP